MGSSTGTKSSRLGKLRFWRRRPKPEVPTDSERGLWLPPPNPTHTTEGHDSRPGSPTADSDGEDGTEAEEIPTVRHSTHLGRPLSPYPEEAERSEVLESVSLRSASASIRSPKRARSPHPRSLSPRMSGGKGTKTPPNDFFDKITSKQTPETEKQSTNSDGWWRKHIKGRKAKVMTNTRQCGTDENLTTEDQEDWVDEEDHAESKPPRSLSSRVWGGPQTKQFFRAKRDAIRGFKWWKKTSEKDSSDIPIESDHDPLSGEASNAHRSSSRCRGRQGSRDAPGKSRIASNNPLTVREGSTLRARSASDSSFVRKRPPSRLSRKPRNTSLSRAFTKTKSPSRLPSTQRSKTGFLSRVLLRSSGLAPQGSFRKRSWSPRVKQLKSTNGNVRNILYKKQSEERESHMASIPGPRTTTTNATTTPGTRLDPKRNPEVMALVRQYQESQKKIHVAQASDVSDPLSRGRLSDWDKQRRKFFATAPKDGTLFTAGSTSKTDNGWSRKEPVIPVRLSRESRVQSQNVASAEYAPTTGPEVARLGRTNTCTTYHSAFDDQEEGNDSETDEVTIKPHHLLPILSHTDTRRQSSITGLASPPSLQRVSAVAAYKTSNLTSKAKSNASQGLTSTQSRSDVRYPTQTRIMRAGYKHTSPMAAGTMRGFQGKKSNGDYTWHPQANLTHRPSRQSLRK